MKSAPFDISCELWREYEFGGRVYRIDTPLQLFVGKTTHRIFDGTVCHCVPAPGIEGCVLRWEPRDKSQPVQF